MPDLRQFFEQAPKEPFSGKVYRIVVTPFAGHILSVRGAFARGGRYNIRDHFGCLYTSLSPDLAKQEMQRYFTIKPDCGLVEAEIELRLAKVVDLTIEHDAGFSRADLVTESHIIPGEVGLRAWEAGVEGLRVPSMVEAESANLVVFLDNHLPGWRLQLRSVEPLS